MKLFPADKEAIERKRKHEDRRKLIASGGGKQPWALTAAVIKADISAATAKPTDERETTMTYLKARRRGWAGVVKVIGNTVFNFDQDGICRCPNIGHAAYDFKVLLRLNGVEQITDDEKRVISDHVNALGPEANRPKDPFLLSNKKVEDKPAKEAAPPPPPPVEEPAVAAMESAPPDVVVPPPKEEVKETRKSKKQTADKGE